MSMISSGKDIYATFILILAIMFFGGCSDDVSPAGPEETYNFMVTYSSSSSQLNLADLPVYTIEEQKTVKLSDLVDTSLITEPYNYAYRPIGSDGFYANLKGSPDNSWDHMQDGYIVLSTMGVTFDISLGLISRYNIRDAAELKILRKIDFITPADSLIQHIVDEMTPTAFEDSLNGIALTEFIPEEVVSSPSSYVYKLIAADDYSIILSYEQLQKGFYIIDRDQILYTDSEITGSFKIKTLNRLIAKTPSE